MVAPGAGGGSREELCRTFVSLGGGNPAASSSARPQVQFLHALRLGPQLSSTTAAQQRAMTNTGCKLSTTYILCHGEQLHVFSAEQWRRVRLPNGTSVNEVLRCACT